MNPYRTWLGITESLSTPDYFQLLGITREETVRAEIVASAKQQIQKLKPYRQGEHSELCQKIFEEVRLARQVLIDPNQRQKYLAALKDANNRQPISSELFQPFTPSKATKTADGKSAKSDDESKCGDNSEHEKDSEQVGNSKPKEKSNEFAIPSALRISNEEWEELDDEESPKSKLKLIAVVIGCLTVVGLLIAAMVYFPNVRDAENISRTENGYERSIWQSDAREFVPIDDFSGADDVASQAAFDSAVNAFSAKRFDEASEKFRSALRLAPDVASKLKVYEFLIPTFEQTRAIDALIDAHVYVQNRADGNDAIKQANANLFNSLELAHTNSDPFAWRGVRTSLRPKQGFNVGQVTVPYSTLAKLRTRFLQTLEEYPNHEPSLYGLITLYSTSVGLNPNAKDKLVIRLCAVREHRGEQLENESVLELVQALTRFGYHQKAAVVCQKVADDYNNVQGIWFRIAEAECLSRAGENEKALAALTIALDWSRNLVPVDRFSHLERIGDLYLLLQKTSNAVTVYESAIKAGIESNVIKQSDLKTVESKIEFAMQRSGNS